MLPAASDDDGGASGLVPPHREAEPESQNQRHEPEQGRLDHAERLAKTVGPVTQPTAEQVTDDGASTVLYQRRATSTRVLSESQADLVTYALRGVIDGGTGAGRCTTTGGFFSISPTSNQPNERDDRN